MCRTKPIQAIRLKQTIKKMKMNSVETIGELGDNLKAIEECPSDDGAISYWNLNKHAFHVDSVNKTWEPCSDINYTLGIDGSMEQYKHIFLNRAVKVWLISGDWDDVVPYRDTEKGLAALKVGKVGEWEPWFFGQHHAGFYQEY